MNGGQRGATRHVLVVSKVPSYQTYVEEQDDARTKELLAKGDPAVAQVLAAYLAHRETLREASEAFEALGVACEMATLATLRSYCPDDFDLVVTVGGDGTLLSTSHEVGPSTPLLGINSAPNHSVGFFCGARQGGVQAAVEAALDGTMTKVIVSRMQVDLNGACLSRRVLNDVLFCHEVPAMTSRYILKVVPGDGPPLEEDQASSGVWIGPAAGSTAALRSAGGRVLPLTSRRIQYVVREPYIPMSKSLSLGRGTVGPEACVAIRCKTRQAKLYLDGPHVVHEVELGDEVTMRRSNEPLIVMGLAREPAMASQGRPS